MENKKESILEKEEFKKNWLVQWLRNLKNTKKNYKKVKSSPYASLVFALKVRKVIIGLLIPYLIYMGINLAMKVRTDGIMGIVQKVVSIGIMAFICWKIYATIPAAKRQIEYYKKNPHTINYCPTNVKEDVDTILAKIKQNQLNEQKSKEAIEKNGIGIKEKGSTKDRT